MPNPEAFFSLGVVAEKLSDQADGEPALARSLSSTFARSRGASGQLAGELGLSPSPRLFLFARANAGV